MTTEESELSNNLEAKSFIDKINDEVHEFQNYTREMFMAVRKRTLKKLFGLLDKTQRKNKTIIKIMQKVEEYICMYSAQNKSVDDPHGLKYYVDKYVSVYTNLNPSSYVRNENLLERLLNEEITPSKIVFGNAMELFPERWEKVLSDINEVNTLKSNSMEMPTTDIYKCYQCGQRKCIYVEQQTRSLDEPYTIFVKCMNCGNTWKM